MISIPQRLLGEALLISAAKQADKTAIIIKDQSYSYSYLRTSADNLARFLINRGIKKGDRVAIYMNNTWECIVSIYGVTLSGAVFLIINSQTKADKLQYILNDSGAKVLITEGWLGNEFLQSLENVKNVHHIILHGDTDQFAQIIHTEITGFEQVISNSILATFPRIIPNDLAALIYTSGSTGFPKGVMMNHQSMVFTSWSLIEYLRLTREERIILLLPLAFDYGLYQLLMAITTGGTLIVEQSFIFQASIYKQMELSRPTVFPGVPTIYAMMIASHRNTGISFSSVQKVTNTAATLPAEFIPELRKIFPNALIFKMYGLTECKRVCYLEPELIDLKPDSVGKAIPGTEVFLLSPEGKPVPAGERGILHIRGPHIMLGYWNKPDLSKEMLRDGTLPYERILCSNDWFTMDNEGFLYFQGRTDDIIKTRGEKVSPVEIENVIYKIAGIREAAAIGVPDEIMGESVVVYVTIHNESHLNEKEIQMECKSKLEMFMVPKRILFLKEMPKSTNGKIDKKLLKEKYQENG